MILLNTLNRRRGRQPDVRETALEQHFKFDDADAHHSVTVQDAALHLEMADPMLVNQLTSPFQRSLVSLLCDLLWCHRLL
jgi:hypothetical protein